MQPGPAAVFLEADAFQQAKAALAATADITGKTSIGPFTESAEPGKPQDSPEPDQSKDKTGQGQNNQQDPPEKQKKPNGDQDQNA